MAPEQLGVGGGPPDARADVYALGAMLFEVVTLESLHDRTDLDRAVLSTLRGVEARPSVRAPGRAVPPEVDAICVQATALEPDARYADARALARELERFLDGDRDLALRREMSVSHALAAKEYEERALAGGPRALDARAAAMRELGRALALDPDNATALASVARLMMTPPAEVPPEAAAEIERQAQETERMAARMSIGAYVVCVAIGLLTLAMDVEPWLLWSYLGLMLSAAGITAVGGFARRSHPATAYLAVLASSAGFATLSRLLGPFVLVPAVVGASTTLFALMPRRGLFFTALAAGCAAVLVPAGLEWAGVIAPSYAFGANVLEVLPTSASLRPLPTMILLVASSVGAIVVPAVMCAKTRAALSDAERKVRLQAWHLGRMAPSGTNPAVDR
jgi:serine/threonine-protein kinase